MLTVPYQTATVTLDFTARIVGGIPTNPEMIAAWISAAMPDVKQEEREKLSKATASELPKLADDTAKAMWTTFKRENGNGPLYVEGRCLKAMIKENANILREALIKSEGEKKGKSRFTNLKAKAAERVFVLEPRVPVMRDGKRVEKPDGNEERPIHVVTPLGPRTALKKVDYVEPPCQITFTLKWLVDGIVDRDLIAAILDHASLNGFGADRSQGNGTFRVKELELVK